MDKVSPVVAANARALRAKQQRRQQDVADAAQMHRSTLSLIEGGGRRITLEEVAALCRGLGVGLPALLAGADPELLEVLQVRVEPA